MIVSPPILCPRFIGRESELATVAERSQAAARGGGSVVLLAGDAGIGKTRFLNTIRNVVEEQGARFVLAQCLQHAQSPLGPLAEALSALHATFPGVLREPALRAGLARIIPELLEEIASVPIASENRRAHYGAIVAALHRFSEKQTIVLAVEDAHWADLATLEFLQYLALRVHSMPLLLVVSYRSDEMHRQHPLMLALPKIERAGNTAVVALPAFSRSEMQRFAAAALEGRARPSASHVRDAIERAEGNPLFAEELLAHVTAAAQSSTTRDRLPLSIQASIVERTGVLDEHARQILSCAAVLGRRFDANLLAKLSGHSRQEVDTNLRLARDLHLIVEQSDGTFIFRHALVQEALHLDLLGSEARDLHLRLARELEDLPASDERTLELAYHYWAARDREKAAIYNEAAGDIAALRLALADATRYYERALEVGPQDEAVEASINAKLARTLSALDPGERARRAFERSIAYYERVGNGPRAAELLLDLGRFEWKPGAQLQTRRRALEAIAPFPDDPVRFGVLTELACWHTLTADPDMAEAYLQQAAPLAGAPKLRYLAHYHTIRARSALLRGNTEEIVASHERAIQTAHETTDFEELCAAYGATACYAMHVGDTQRARANFEMTIRVARERFLHDREAINLAIYAGFELLLGNIERARALLLASADLSIDLERPYTSIQQAIVAAALGVQTGERELIERFARDEFIEIAFSTEEASLFTAVASAFAELFASRGEVERAAELVERALSRIQSIGWFPPLTLSVARFASPDLVATARAMLERWARPVGNEAGRAYLDLFEATLAARACEHAVDAAARAARWFAQVGYLRYAAMAYEAGGDAKAALAMYRRCGALADIGRLEAQLNPINRRGRAKSELTLREREVADLVAHGKSNRAIAQALALSERTVEHHISSILAKLEAGSRSQIAVAFAREQPAQR